MQHNLKEKEEEKLRHQRASESAVEESTLFLSKKKKRHLDPPNVTGKQARSFQKKRKGEPPCRSAKAHPEVHHPKNG
jgi:hypothetical protein